MTFRAELFNALNTVVFSGPTTSVTSSTFGKIIAEPGQYAAAGAVQLAVEVLEEGADYYVRETSGESPAAARPPHMGRDCDV